jgi:hypothetical protein
VPPYVVFGDVTLREMVTYRPRDADELACLTGVGAVKLERYAEDFLGVLAEHEAEHGRPGAADLGEVVDLPDADLKRIRNAIEQLADGPNLPLKPVYEGLEGRYPYDLLRCVRAAEFRQSDSSD